tara:strand:- start:74 stop:1195 length:1122 start_codon:yes stop_codon:yes gene_type:complete
MENTVEEIGGMKVFSNPEDLAASMNQAETPQQETQSEPQVEAQPEAQPEPQTEVQQESFSQTDSQPEETQYVDPEAAPEVQQQDQQYTEEDIERAVYSFISDKLGRDIESIEDLQVEQTALDERIEAIANFVTDTGRDPSDWFAYQSLNPSEMDDMTAIRVNMAAQYENLAPEEISTLLQSKYKLNPDVHTEEEIRLSQLQMKIDGQAAKQEIEKIRSEYAAPEIQEQMEEEADYFDEGWVNDMVEETASFDGLEFDLGNGKTFTYGVDDNYREQMVRHNVNIDSYLSNYVRDDGSWDYDTFNSHLAVLDNIDNIVANAYKQGLGDGQKGIVEKAANVGVSDPNPNTGQPNVSPVVEQLKNIIGTGNTMTFKI